MTEKFKPESAEGNPVGETWGETRKRIILEKVEASGVSGLPVADVLSILKKYMFAHEREIGGDPDTLGDNVVDNEDVRDVLLEFNKQGTVEIKEGRIYLVDKK